MAEPDQHGSQQAPEQHHQGETEDDRQPLIGGQHQPQQLFLRQGQFVGPALNRTVITAELLLETGQGASDQSKHAFFGGRLSFLGGVAEFFQVVEKFGALLIVFQGLDHFIQRLPKRFLCLRLAFL